MLDLVPDSDIDTTLGRIIVVLREYALNEISVPAVMIRGHLPKHQLGHIWCTGRSQIPLFGGPRCFSGFR